MPSPSTSPTANPSEIVKLPSNEDAAWLPLTSKMSIDAGHVTGDEDLVGPAADHIADSEPVGDREVAVERRRRVVAVEVEDVDRARDITGHQNLVGGAAGDVAGREPIGKGEVAVERRHHLVAADIEDVDRARHITGDEDLVGAVAVDVTGGQAVGEREVAVERARA